MTGALATDLYELNMAASYLRREMVGPATFSLFVRNLPPGRGFLVASGLEDCLAFLERFCFDEDELAWLGGTLGFDQPALDAFRRLRFTGEVWAVPEGRVVFAGEPLLEVTAPVAEAMAVARASAIVGFVATSNVEAARRFGLRAAGTMAHSFIEAFGDERAAFRAFAEDYPDRCTFLVDTYDTLGGVRAAIDVIRQLGLRDQLGVRLDSGDLGALAVQTRRLLDQAGLGEVRIFASGSLDEFVIAELIARAAPIDAYGIGTKMGVSADAPYLDSAYKLVAYGDRPVLKLSPEKATAPGAKQVFRAPDAHRELVGLREEPAPEGHEPLLVPVMAGGRRTRPAEGVEAARARFQADLAWLPDRARAIHDPRPVPVAFSERAERLREQAREDVARRVATTR